MSRALLFLALLLAGDPYAATVEQWRQAREQSLKSDSGWLTVSGLDWLHEGRNTVEKTVFELRQGHVFHEGKEMRPDSPDHAQLGDVALFVIKRGDRYGIRVKDKNSRFRREFAGLHYFPIRKEYRVAARFVAAPAKIPIANILGQTENLPSPGYAVFHLEGRELKLYPVLESPDAQSLFFIFRDLTSGKETYGAGRFLDTDLPKDGRVVLDFNKAYNPPCAFTPYATCPLPPPRNRLPVRIEAGELKYGAH